MHYQLGVDDNRCWRYPRPQLVTIIRDKLWAADQVQHPITRHPFVQLPNSPVCYRRECSFDSKDWQTIAERETAFLVQAATRVRPASTVRTVGGSVRFSLKLPVMKCRVRDLRSLQQGNRIVAYVTKCCFSQELLGTINGYG